MNLHDSYFNLVRFNDLVMLSHCLHNLVYTLSEMVDYILYGHVAIVLPLARLTFVGLRGFSAQLMLWHLRLVLGQLFFLVILLWFFHVRAFHLKLDLERRDLFLLSALLQPLLLPLQVGQLHGDIGDVVGLS